MHEVDEHGEVVLVNAAWGGFLGGGDPGGLADDFSHHAAGAHDAGGAEGATVDGDATSGHEEVLDIFRVHDAVGDGVSGLAVGLVLVDGDGDEGVVFGDALHEFFFGVVEVDGPGGGDAAVGEFFFRCDVIAGKDDVALESA